MGLTERCLQWTQVPMLGLLLLSSVTLGKSFHLSEPWSKGHVLGSEDTIELDPVLSSVSGEGDSSNTDNKMVKAMTREVHRAL